MVNAEHLRHLKMIQSRKIRRGRGITDGGQGRGAAPFVPLLACGLLPAAQWIGGGRRGCPVHAGDRELAGGTAAVVRVHARV